MNLSTAKYSHIYPILQQYRRSNHSGSLVNYHQFWIPKRRKRVLVNDVEKRLREIVWEVGYENGLVIIDLEIMPDHIHLLVKVFSTISPHQVVKAIKGISSRVAEARISSSS